MYRQGYEPSPYEALGASIVSFWLTRISAKVNVFASWQRDRKRPSCGWRRPRWRVNPASLLAELRSVQTVSGTHECRKEHDWNRAA